MSVDPRTTPTSGRIRAALRSPITRKVMTVIATTLACVAAVCCFVGAPVALVLVNTSMTDAELVRMSNVGQAYGGLSALLSGAATIGFAAALILQVRQVKISQAQAARMMQIELMKMLIEDPSLRPMSPSLRGESGEQRRRDIFSNLTIKYLQMGYEIGYFSAGSLRSELMTQFAVADIRRFWEKSRPIFESGIHSGLERRFVDLVDEAYRAAAVEAPEAPSVDEVKRASTRPRGGRYKIAGRGLALAAVVFAGGRIAHKLIRIGREPNAGAGRKRGA